MIADHSWFSAPDFYPRPGFGTSGRPISVLANQYEYRTTSSLDTKYSLYSPCCLTRFQARFKGQGKIIMHYDVEINPVVRVQNQKKPVGLMRQCWAM